MISRLRFGPIKSATNFGADALRFIVAGAANTALTLVVYQVLLYFFSAPAAYVLAWTAGVGLVVAVYPERVFFGGRKDLVSRLLLGTSYAAVFLVGLLAINLLEAMRIPSRLSILVVMPITTALNLAFGRLLLRGRQGWRDGGKLKVRK